jgi:hypothetical protein
MSAIGTSQLVVIGNMPSFHIRANMFGGSPRALYLGLVKIKGVLCDLLICITLIT